VLNDMVMDDRENGRWGRTRLALTDQRGTMLVEAVVGAAMLLILSMGFLAALDAAGHASGNLRSRGVAASLARDDMERMRALKVTDLVNMNATRTQTVGGVTFTIRSTTRWVDDVTGDATCGSGATKTDYLKAVSTVTFPAMGTTQPVVNESIVAVPNGSISGNTGGLIVKVSDRAGAPVAGVGVTITGPVIQTGSTDAAGCAMWGAAPVGGYYVDVAQPGYVDRSGASTVRKTTTVVSGGTNSVAFEYDRAARLDVNFETQIGANVVPATAREIFWTHSGMPQGSDKATSSTPATTISTGTKLFPFPDPYAVWGGGCTGADPRNYGGTAPLVTMAPGGTQSVTVRLPALNLVVQKSGVPMTAAQLANAHVRITPATPGCGSTFGGSGMLNTAGRLNAPGLPYGDYNVCADDGTRRVSTSSAIQNRTAAGSPTVTLNITSTSTRALCA
jgi:hypothetical protein